MKKKGKIHPRDVPPSESIRYNKEKSEKIKENYSNFTKREIEEVKSPFKSKVATNENNYKSYQDNSFYNSKKSQDLFKTEGKSNKEKRQRKIQERIFKETSTGGTYQNIESNIHHENKEEYKQDEYKRNEYIHKNEVFWNASEDKKSNFSEIKSLRLNFPSPKIKNKDSSKSKYVGNKNQGWNKESKKNFQEQEVKNKDRKKKVSRSAFHKDERKVYDPLSQDSDNDGVIDRYDMNFSDSRVSYRDTSDDDKYLPNANEKKNNWENISILGNKKNFKKNKFKRIYQEQDKSKGRNIEEKVTVLNDKFRKRSLSNGLESEVKKR